MGQEELRQQLAAMFAERKAADPAYSYGKFGQDLAKMIGRPEPYKRQYISNVMQGVKGYPVSAELAEGLARLGQVADGVSEFQAKLHQAPAGTLSMAPLHPGSIVMGESKLCATPGCGIWFVGPAGRKYCPKCHPPKRKTR